MGIKKRPLFFKNALYLINIIWKEDKFLLLLLTVETLCNAAIPFFGIYLPKLVIELLTTHADTNIIFTQLGGFILAMGCVYFLGHYARSGNKLRYNALRLTIMMRLFIKTLEVDYSELESPEGQSRYQRAVASLMNGDECCTSRMIPALTGLMMGILGFGAYSGVLMTLHPLIVVLLVITSLVIYFTIRRALDYERSRKDDIARLAKKVHYIGNRTDDYTYGKDIRLYRIQGLFFSLRDALIRDLIKVNEKIQNKRYLTIVADAVITLLRDGFAYAYLIWMVLNDDIQAADFVFYFGAIAGFSSWLTTILNEFNTVNGAHLEIGDIRDYLEQRASHDPEFPAMVPDLSMALSIVFEDVSFSYEKAGECVLSHFNMDIKAGEKIALVGVNGAGKTTLVKLLCGFYIPDEGRILINGTDIASYRREDLYSMFSAIFQDIMILPYTLAENVALCPGVKIDKERVKDSLKRADLLAHVEAQPKGVDAMMLRLSDEDGLIFSGGQQQKLLLARALYKDAPILILDEPTAALDPIAESELYEQYHALAKNKTAIYISHRLASTRFCDRIIYLNNGTAEEVGTHEALMVQGGGYAHMFELQSHYYKDNVEEAV